MKKRRVGGKERQGPIWPRGAMAGEPGTAFAAQARPGTSVKTLSSGLGFLL